MMKTNLQIFHYWFSKLFENLFLRFSLKLLGMKILKIQVKEAQGWSLMKRPLFINKICELIIRTISAMIKYKSSD